MGRDQKQPLGETSIYGGWMLHLSLVWINGVEVAREAGTDIAEPATFDSWTDQGSGHSHEASKADPPNYETVDVAFETGSATEPQGKLAVTWGRLKK